MVEGCGFTAPTLRKNLCLEQWIEGGFKGHAVYTVPSALANDKFREWKERGWEVGLVTGDIRHQPNAPVVVATLRLARGYAVSTRSVCGG